MKVIIDGYWWSDGPPSGKMVVRNLIETWLEVHPQDRLVVTTNAIGAADLTRLHPGLQVIVLRLRPHGLANLIEVPLRLRRVGYDGFLAMNFTPPHARASTFLLDVLFQSNPEWFTWLERRYFSAMVLSARWARMIFTISHTEAARISRFNPSLRRVVCVGLAPSRSLLQAPPTQPSNWPNLGPASFEFLLCVGRLNVRKNLSRTIDAMVQSGILTDVLRLIVVGEKDGRRASFSAVVRQAVDTGHIVFMGGVSDSELKWLYQRSIGLIFMSLDEGFGLPPVEAAALGTPVVVSDIPVFHETLGEHAHYADPLSVVAIQSAVKRLLVDQRSQVKDGSETPDLSWQAVVRGLREGLIERAVAENTPRRSYRFGRRKQDSQAND